MTLKSGLYGYLGNHEGFVGGVYLCEMPSLDMYKAVMESIIDRLNKYETAVEGYDNFTVSWHLWGGIGFSLHGIKEDWAPKDLIYFRYVQDTVKMTESENLSEKELMRLLLLYDTLPDEGKEPLNLMVKVANNAMDILSTHSQPNVADYPYLLQAATGERTPEIIIDGNTTEIGDTTGNPLHVKDVAVIEAIKEQSEILKERLPLPTITVSANDTPTIPEPAVVENPESGQRDGGAVLDGKRMAAVQFAIENPNIPIYLIEQQYDLKAKTLSRKKYSTLIRKGRKDEMNRRRKPVSKEVGNDFIITKNRRND